MYVAKRWLGQGDFVKLSVDANDQQRFKVMLFGINLLTLLFKWLAEVVWSSVLQTDLSTGVATVLKNCIKFLQKSAKQLMAISNYAQSVSMAMLQPKKILKILKWEFDALMKEIRKTLDKLKDDTRFSKLAKIEVGEASLLWIWTHDLVNWLRLQAWTWWR